MKQLLLLLFIICLVAGSNGQISTTYDTLRRNEIHVSIMPVLAVLAGYPPEGRYVNWNFGYRRYLKNRFVLRASFTLFTPWRASVDPNPETFVRTQDTLNVFRNVQTDVSAKPQLNLGVEKIFRVRRFIHGFGAELLLNTQTYHYHNDYYWYPTFVSGDFDQRKRYSHSPINNQNSIYNGIDSLSYSYNITYKGAGARVFYSLRYMINKYLYISTTLGVSGTGMYGTATYVSGNRKKYTVINGWTYDVSLLLSDLSIAFRF